MIDIDLYRIQGFIPIGKDKYGGNLLTWKRIYCQKNHISFEYSDTEEKALNGDFIQWNKNM